MFQNFENRSEGALSAERIGALRARLEAKGLTGFLVPRSDAHQGEVVAPCDARLAWLTGFTGSAGIAVVLAERAAIFVDGRYTLQAADQCDTGVVEVVPSMQRPLGDWLGGALSAGDVLGYDPWLHGRDEVDRLEEALAPAEVRLVAVRENPVDAIWTDRPPPPGGAVSIREEALAGEAASVKRARLGAEMGADAAFLSLPDSLAWLLNIRGSDLEHSPVALGFGLLHGTGRVDLFMEPDKFGGAERAHLGPEVEIHRADDL
ncbi:MAG: aminopeptidase P family N-terminal domain-containing protein, partial [Pseudomonadota bacterium]